jgi:LPS-assembly protein
LFLTIKPRFFSDNKFILQNEYRQKTKNSFTIADFSFTKGHSSNTEDKNDNRSHFFSNSKIDLDLKEFSNSILEINYEKTSNDNYLKLFNLDSPLLLDGLDVLESKIQLNLEHQNYDFSTSFEMYETLDGANSDRYEYILPTYNFSKNYNIENLNGGLNFNSNGNNTLNLTNVVTSVVTNDLNYTSYYNYFDNGIKSNYGVYLKNINSKGKNNPKYKSSLNSELASAYIFNTSLPLTKNTKKTFNTLEPKLSIRISPNDMKNNNNLERKVDMNNIYNINRLDMNNSYEGGESLTVGFDFKKEKVTTKNKANEIEDYFEFRMATIFRNKHEKNIPITSTLNKKQSNVFGQLNYKPTKNFSLDYDFSLNNNLSTFEYNSLNAKINHNNFFTQFNLIEEKGLIGLTNVVENITKYNIDEENILSFKTRRNRNLNLTEYYDLLYQYKNDCLIAGIQYKKNYYNDADIKPVEELFFTITIVPLTTFSSDKVSLN